MLKAALYIHFPWCIRKCPYCDFNSHKSPGNIPEEAYIQALVADFDEDLSLFQTREISSIFLGGGTPSLFSEKSLETLFDALKKRTPFAKDLEITMEANPGTVEQHRFYGYQEIGINRLSLGIQSFHAGHLKKLGRIHDDNQARKAIEAARLAGFNAINIDLMHSLSGQSVQEAMDDLKEALTFQPEHLSWYQLTLEPNTVFYKQKPPLPHENITEAIENQGFMLLKGAGYDHYEISAFSKTGRQSRHNLNYWLFGDYFGIGAGAHGKLTLDGQVIRTAKHRQPAEYLNPDKAFMASKQAIEKRDLLFEFMLNTTRLNTPIPFDLFQEKTGLDFSILEPELRAAMKSGLVHLDATSWQVSEFGRRFTNDLQALFLSQ